MLFLNQNPNDSFSVESGICSYYGAENEIPPDHIGPCNNKFDRWAMKAAHKTLPCGTRIRVRNLENGKSVVVTIDDRGPYVPGRIVDLTYGAFGQVEDYGKGLFKCDYQIL